MKVTTNRAGNSLHAHKHVALAQAEERLDTDRLWPFSGFRIGYGGSTM